MNITKEQLETAETGQPVELVEDGKEFVLIRRDLYDRVKHVIEYDDSDWTEEEMSRLAAETFEAADEAGPIS
jgi:hypothetical protein